MQSMVPFYTPEWNPAIDKESGQALMKIYLHMLEQVINRLNQVPDKNFIKFLDMLGIKMLPAQSARAQITFKLADGTKEHVTVPKGTLVVGEGTDGNEVTFETQADLRVSPSVLQEIYSFDGGQDEIFVHTDEFSRNQKFHLISGQNKQERSLYIGHADLFSQTNPSKIIIDFNIVTGATGGILKIVWEYWGGERWVELQSFEAIAKSEATVIPEEQLDTTELLRRSGQMIVRKEHIGEIVTYELFGNKSRWLRCRLKNNLLANVPVQLPIINTIGLSVKPLTPFPAELAFNNDIPLNIEEKLLEVSEPIIGLEINLSILAPVIKGQKNIDLGIDFAKLKVGDLIKLSNGIDPPEIMKVDAIPTAGSIFTVDKNFKYRYETTDSVKFLTKVKIKQVEDFTINSKIVILKEGNNKVIASLEQVVKTDDKQFIAALYIGRFGATAANAFNANSLVLIPSIRPFGELPALFDTFYIASDEAFSKKGSSITLDIDSEWATDEDPKKRDFVPNAVLSWEYWNGKSWQTLGVIDRTNRFEHGGNITFTCPLDIEKIQVNGEEKYWIRVRIIDGDYGREIILIPKEGKNVDIEKGKIHYPIINSLKINYKGTSEKPQQCFSLNNLDNEDHIKAVLDTQKIFTPFKKFLEPSQGVLLGFDKQIVGGPFRILFNLTEQVVSETDTLKMEWSYWSGEQWIKINAQDNTENLTRIGLFDFTIPVGFSPRILFNKEQYWIKGTVASGQFNKLDSTKEGIKVPEIIGIFLNSTTAVQASVVDDEVLGTSDLTANQAFQLLNPLIISQQVLITEPFPPSADEIPEILKEEGKDAIEEIKDELDEILGSRVRWHEVDDFYDSKPKSRHYVVDKRQGIILFGDGINGLVPPRGSDNIRINYHFGGGKNGNVAAGQITGLKNAIPFVNEVTNPLPADGGSETETIEEVLDRGPKQLKNRDRAVTKEDFEALARNASRKIARAKCLPNTDDVGNSALGHVSILIVPDTQTANEPVSRSLRDVVSQYLNEQSSNLLSTAQDIHVRGAYYIEIIIEAVVVPVSLEATARVDEGVTKALKRYIHPLTGGRQGKGWEFGKNICRSEIIALLEGISDIDHVEELVIYADGKLQKEDHFIDAHVLPFSGEHKVNIKFDPTDSLKNKNGLKPECKIQDIEFCPEEEK